MRQERCGWKCKLGSFTTAVKNSKFKKKKSTRSDSLNRKVAAYGKSTGNLVRRAISSPQYIYRVGTTYGIIYIAVDFSFFSFLHWFEKFLLLLLLLRSTMPVVRPQNLNDVFLQAANAAKQKLPELTHNQKVRPRRFRSIDGINVVKIQFHFSQLILTFHFLQCF
jgi:hypothetical protein